MAAPQATTACPEGSSHLVVPTFSHPTRPLTPAHSISLTPKPFLDDALSKVYVGIAIEERENAKEIESVVVVTNGRSVLRCEHALHPAESHERLLSDLLDKIEEYARVRGHKVEIVALSSPLSSTERVPSFSSTPLDHFIDRTWLSLDALPFLASSETGPSNHFSLHGQALAAVDEAVNSLEISQTTTMRIQFDAQRQVLVDANHRVQLYSLSLLKRISPPPLFSTFETYSQTLIRDKVRIGFFSATPRGGGVALMRHALMRLWQRVGVDAGWYVPPGDSNVFNVTKRKFHNVLQGVAPPKTILTEQDKELFTRWAEWYFTKLWKDKDGDGSTFLESFDVIVIDDPQVLGLVPHIRRYSPRTKIIYRSHIQIRADLIDRGVEQQKTTWDFLWQFIGKVDLFVAHPLDEFVPQIVKASLPVVFMPPSTSPLDGLNKPIPSRYLDFYRRSFNQASLSALGREVDWKRGYILQIARFDPSKGIPDIVEAYRLFRVAFERDPQLAGRTPPQLVLTGHSSIDDPDAVTVLKALHAQIAHPLFDSIRDVIFSVRAPSSDRLLDTILQGAAVICQVSTREGYEIKVSEAISQGKWIIGTRAGGIPLQIREGVDGDLVDPGDPKGISEALLNFYASVKPGQSRSEGSEGKIHDLLVADTAEYSRVPRSRLIFLPTVANASMWSCLFLRLLAGDQRGYVKNSTDEQNVTKVAEIGQGLDGLNGKRIWDVLSDSMRS
ncbi:hypothetical protein JCM16303_000760 [Sporobolomyces ruberrimus]